MVLFCAEPLFKDGLGGWQRHAPDNKTGTKEEVFLLQKMFLAFSSCNLHFKNPSCCLAVSDIPLNGKQIYCFAFVESILVDFKRNFGGARLRVATKRSSELMLSKMVRVGVSLGYQSGPPHKHDSKSTMKSCFWDAERSKHCKKGPSSNIRFYSWLDSWPRCCQNWELKSHVLSGV